MHMQSVLPFPVPASDTDRICEAIGIPTYIAPRGNARPLVPTVAAARGVPWDVTILIKSAAMRIFISLVPSHLGLDWILLDWEAFFFSSTVFSPSR